MKRLIIALMFFFALATSTTFAASNFSPLAYSAYQQPLKKDGTPDKRYNANKHLKKDGTPDMRYSTSKKAVSKKTVKTKN